MTNIICNWIFDIVPEDLLLFPANANAVDVLETFGPIKSKEL